MVDRRRRALIGSASAAGLASAASVGWLVPTASLAQETVATPAQTLGPFYPSSKPAETDSDLTKVGVGAKLAAGDLTHVSGNVFDTRGKPIIGIAVEIWQCNAFGRYHHPGDTSARTLDPNFQGYGRAITDAGGGYYFRTIKPVPYPGRTPHIHFRLSGPSIADFSTQLYIAGHPQNDDDGLLRSVRNQRGRDTLLAIFEKIQGVDEWRAKWDIVIARRA
ncbi:MAG: intradiol ring-cleavage dioxygenase [Burkholderiales bacterium]